MPASVEVDDARRRVVVQLRECVAHADLAGLLVFRRDRALRSHALLVDCGAAATTLLTDDVRALIDEWRDADGAGGEDAGDAGPASVPTPRSAPTAFVAERDALFGMLRMLQLLTEEDGPVFYVARTCAEAETWLATH